MKQTRSHRTPLLPHRPRTSIVERLLGLVMLLVLMGGALGVAKAAAYGQPLVVVGILALMLITTIGVLRFMKWRTLRDMDQESARADELHARLAGSSAPLILERSLPMGWPLILTAFFSIPVVMAAFVERAALGPALSITLPCLALVWGLAWRSKRKPIGTLDAGAFTLPDQQIPWTSIERLTLEFEYKSEVPFLRLRLLAPLPARSFGARINAFLSRGKSARELIVKLHRSVEPPAVVHEMATHFWQNAVGEARAFRMQGELIAEYQAELMPFSKRPRAERARMLVAVLVILGWIALCAYGLAADFLLSPAWLWPSAGLAFALTAAGLVALLRGPGLASVRNGHGTASYLAVFVFVVLMLSTASWGITARALPDLYTRVAGAPREIVQQMRKAPERKHCRHPIEGELYADRFPSDYCASLDEYTALPQQGLMRVRARESWFGTHVNGIEAVDPEWHR